MMNNLIKTRSFCLEKECGEMVQMSSTCSNGYKCDQGGFVLPQFRARYCGHTLSRLAEIRHNKTKQTAFPTIRREGASKELEWRIQWYSVLA
jgi:hypothetical protein